MRSFIVFLCFIPVLLFSCRSVSLETQLKEAIKDRKAEIGIAVIIDEKDTVTVNILFDYQGGPDAVNRYIHSLGIRDCAIVGTETAMHEDLDLCYQNWSTPLAAAELMEIFRREPLFAQEYKDFIYQT